MRQIIGNKTGSPYDIGYANKTINIGRKIARILHINKNSSFYIKLQKKYGAKSSYKR